MADVAPEGRRGEPGVAFRTGQVRHPSLEAEQWAVL